MPSSSTRPDQFNTNVVASTTSGDGGIDFGFDAAQLILMNDKTVTLYVNLDSTSGSTGGFPLKATETLTIASMRAGRISVATTSTSTGTARVGAWSW